jgi:hypothetical protein
MQKVRAVREMTRSSYAQPWTRPLKRMHAALSGQELPLQLKTVQLPAGCDVSQSRSPRN